MSTKPPKRPFREQLLIEPDVQTALLLRAALHGAALAIYFTVIQYFSQQMLNPDVGTDQLVWQFLDEAIYWGPGLMLLGPLFAYDLLKMSNRFAGPVFRLRREMTRLVSNESEVPISFRDDDFWHDLGDHFNKIRDELMELRSENAMLKQNSPTKSTVAADSTGASPDRSQGEASNEVETDSDAEANMDADDVATATAAVDVETDDVQASDTADTDSAALQNA